VTALSEECRVRSISGCLRSHGGVAGTDNRDTVVGFQEYGKLPWKRMCVCPYGWNITPSEVSLWM